MCIKNSKLRKEKSLRYVNLFHFLIRFASFNYSMSELHFLHSWHITTTMFNKKNPSKLFFTPVKSHMALKGIASLTTSEVSPMKIPMTTVYISVPGV